MVMEHVGKAITEAVKNTLNGMLGDLRGDIAELKARTDELEKKREESSQATEQKWIEQGKAFDSLRSAIEKLHRENAGIKAQVKEGEAAKLEHADCLDKADRERIREGMVKLSDTYNSLFKANAEMKTLLKCLGQNIAKLEKDADQEGASKSDLDALKMDFERVKAQLGMLGGKVASVAEMGEKMAELGKSLGAMVLSNKTSVVEESVAEEESEDQPKQKSKKKGLMGLLKRFGSSKKHKSPSKPSE